MPGDLSPHQKQSDREDAGGDKNQDLEKPPEDGAKKRPSGDQDCHFDASHLPDVGLLFLRGAYVLLSAYVFFWARLCGVHHAISLHPISLKARSRKVLFLATFGVERLDCLGKAIASPEQLNSHARCPRA
jgi:hypothetical protein